MAGARSWRGLLTGLSGAPEQGGGVFVGRCIVPCGPWPQHKRGCHVPVERHPPMQNDKCCAARCDRLAQAYAGRRAPRLSFRSVLRQLFAQKCVWLITPPHRCCVGPPEPAMRSCYGAVFPKRRPIAHATPLPTTAGRRQGPAGPPSKTQCMHCTADSAPQLEAQGTTITTTRAKHQQQADGAAATIKPLPSHETNG